jgi:hypothetical protein
MIDEMGMMELIDLLKGDSKYLLEIFGNDPYIIFFLGYNQLKYTKDTKRYIM